jgi:cyclic nucleotide gated channel alpha 3
MIFFFLVAALGFAIVSTTSIGNLNSSQTLLEGVFTAVIVFTGLMMYAIVIGAASDALANMNAAGAAHKAKTDAVLAYMRDKNVPTFFRRIILDYFNFAYEYHKSSETVLDEIPSVLRSKLSLIVNRDIVDRIPIFASMSVDVYLSTVERLNSTVFLPGDFIFKENDDGDNLYFIKSGKVDGVLKDGLTVFITVGPGSFFGEASMLR